MSILPSSPSIPYSLSFFLLFSHHTAGQRVRSPSVLSADLLKDALLSVKRTLFFKGPTSPMDNPEKFKIVMSLLSGYEVDTVSCTCVFYIYNRSMSIEHLHVHVASLKKSWFGTS